MLSHGMCGEVTEQFCEVLSGELKVTEVLATALTGKTRCAVQWT